MCLYSCCTYTLSCTASSIHGWLARQIVCHHECAIHAQWPLTVPDPWADLLRKLIVQTHRAYKVCCDALYVLACTTLLCGTATLLELLLSNCQYGPQDLACDWTSGLLQGLFHSCTVYQMLSRLHSLSRRASGQMLRYCHNHGSPSVMGACLGTPHSVCTGLSFTMSTAVAGSKELQDGSCDVGRPAAV